jgi:hypothetical protein
MPTPVEITRVSVTSLQTVTIFTDARIVHGISADNPYNLYHILDNDDNIIMGNFNLGIRSSTSNEYNPVPFLAGNGLKIQGRIVTVTEVNFSVFHTKAGR